MPFLNNNKNNKLIENVSSTLAIENLYPDRQFIEKMISVANGKKTEEELIKELNNKYKVNHNYCSTN